jgi:hypothetical protein
LAKDTKQEQSPNETVYDEKEPITQKEFLDGCVGCSSLGCLPFAVVFIGTIVKVF